jgi:NitT/TauT family transport system substrate-binding protein
MKNTIPRRRLLLGTALASLAAMRPARADDPLKVAVGQQGNWETSPPELGQRQGIFKQHGLVLDILYTQGGGETMQAVIPGSADIGVGVGTGGMLAAFSKGAPVRAVGNGTTGANDLFWYVAASSPAKTFKDLAGKTVAYSTNGSSTNLAVLGLMNFHGVKAQPVATGSPAATFTQVMSGQVDAGWSAPPFGIEAMQKGQIRLVARGSEVPTYQNQTVRVLITNVGVTQNRLDLLHRFLAAYRDTLEWMYSGDDALKMYADWVGVPLDLARTTRDQFFPADTLRLDRLAGIDLAMNDAITQKLIAAKLSPAQLDELFKYYAHA